MTKDDAIKAIEGLYIEGNSPFGEGYNAGIATAISTVFNLPDDYDESAIYEPKTVATYPRPHQPEKA